MSTHRDKFRQAALAGEHHLYCYSMESLVQARHAFYDKKKHLVQPLSVGWEPNPWHYQYDLEVDLFLNYQSAVDRQTEWLTDTVKKTHDQTKLTKLKTKLDYTLEFGTGVPRAEHFWNACSLRWPTKVVNGKEIGLFIREPWSEDFIEALCTHEYVYAYGGSGQGKTHRALAFMCIIWDHYIDHQMGGRCRFSTVAEDKIKESAWPYLQRIYSGSQKGISKYCGRGKIMGEYTIGRTHDKKGGSSIKGILIPRRNDNVAVDKITGSHGHPVAMYHIDELQATPEAPIEASPNFLQNTGQGWITASGNYDRNSDSLGKNVKPIGGWDKVTENTHLYESINMLGIRSACIHYNNDLSPAFEGEGFKRWGHILPTLEKREARYPTPSAKRTNAYRRLWIGWKEKTLTQDSVLNKETLREMGCMKRDPDWDLQYPVTHCWSFDTAPTSTDRNVLTHFADGVDASTGRWKLHFYETICIQKIDNADEYLSLASAEIMQWSKKWGVQSGNGIVDWTNITGIPEKLKEHGFLVRPIVYNQSPPDGVKQDKRTKQVHRKICLQHETSRYAHLETTNYISMGALLAQNFVLSGQITGLHEDYIGDHNSDKSYDEELCLRKFISIHNRDLGELTSLEPKHSKHGRTGFTKTNGFSPDILDTIFQACVFAVMYRGMVPGSFSGRHINYVKDNNVSEKEMFKKEMAIHETDALSNWAPRKTSSDDLLLINGLDW